MHDRTHIDEHGLIESRNRAVDEALFDDDAVAKDHGVDDATEVLQDGVLEALLDTLWLSEVERLHIEYSFIGSILEQLSDLRIQVVPISDEHDKLAHLALEKFLSDCCSNGTSTACEQHTLPFELLLEVERWQIAFCLLCGLGDNGGRASFSSSSLYCEEIGDSTKEVPEQTGLFDLDIWLLLLCVLLSTRALLRFSWEVRIHFYTFFNY